MLVISKHVSEKITLWHRLLCTAPHYEAFYRSSWNPIFHVKGGIHHWPTRAQQMRVQVLMLMHARA